MSTYVSIKNLEEWVRLRHKGEQIYIDKGNDCYRKGNWIEGQLQLDHLVVLIEGIKNGHYYTKKTTHIQVTNWQQVLENLKYGETMFIYTNEGYYKIIDDKDLINFNLWIKEDE